MPNKDKLYVNRYKTLKEHQAAVKARKGKEKDSAPQNLRTGRSPDPAPRTRPSTPARTPSRPSTPARTPSRPNQTSNGASLGSKLTPAERARRKAAASPSGVAKDEKKTPPKAKPPKKSARGTARGGSRSSNNNRGRTQTSSGPKAGDTRRTRVGSKYVTQMYNGKKWVNGKVGGKG